MPTATTGVVGPVGMSPPPVRVVAAVRRGQMLFRSPEVDRARLAVVVGQHDGPRALVGGQLVHDGPDLLCDVVPAQHPAEVLVDVVEAQVHDRRIGEHRREQRNDRERGHDDGDEDRHPRAPRPRPLDHDGAERDERQVPRAEVVALAARREQHDEEERVPDGKPPVRGPRRTSNHRPQRGDPHDHPAERDQHELSGDELTGVGAGVVLAQVLEERPRRPVVLRLPHEVRQRERGGDGGAAERPPGAEDRALRCREQAHDRARHPERHRVLVQQPDADDRADAQPEPNVPGAHDSDDEQQRDRPRDQVERHRRQEVARGEVQRAERADRRGQPLREPSSAELAGEQRAHYYVHATDEHGEHVQSRLGCG